MPSFVGKLYTFKLSNSTVLDWNVFFFLVSPTCFTLSQTNGNDNKLRSQWNEDYNLH